MTIREMKALSKRIEQLKSKRARLRSDATNITPSLSGMPSGGHTTDKLGATVSRLADIDSEIEKLTTEYDAHLSRLSHEVFEENCIYLYLTTRDKRYLWRRIAHSTVGRLDAADSIRMRCTRYKW